MRQNVLLTDRAAAMAYRLEVFGDQDHPVRWFDKAEDAMKTLSRLRAEGEERFVIQDAEGSTISIGELAAIVIEQRLSAEHNAEGRP